jgi:hypothetical protein
MTARQAITAYIVGVVAIEFVTLSAMKHLGADSESIGSVYALLLGGGGLGCGFIVNRYL